MRAILVLVFATLSAASNIHYRPAATTNVYIVKSPAAKAQYHEQDSRGFYSYGYSDDTAARAEYTALDGSSKGFYSYVDSDGKLQTVKYEAGRKQGFKAVATNLPTDNSRPPAPVRDTPEVQMAKQAHFEVYREAMIRAALAPERQQNAADEEVSEEQEEANEEQMEADVMQREQILAMMAQNSANDEDKNGMENGSEDKERNENNRLQEYNQDVQREHEITNEQRSNAHRQMTTYTLNEPVTESDPPNLRTIYGLEDDKSSSVLKLGGLNRKSFNYLQPTTLFETVRVPSNSYYTVLAPSNKYTVVTPTVLTSVPHLGNSLPISLSSTFQSHRINGKSA